MNHVERLEAENVVMRNWIQDIADSYSTEQPKKPARNDGAYAWNVWSHEYDEWHAAYIAREFLVWLNAGMPERDELQYTEPVDDIQF